MGEEVARNAETLAAVQAAYERYAETLVAEWWCALCPTSHPTRAALDKHTAAGHPTSMIGTSARLRQLQQDLADTKAELTATRADLARALADRDLARADRDSAADDLRLAGEALTRLERELEAEREKRWVDISAYNNACCELYAAEQQRDLALAKLEQLRAATRPPIRLNGPMVERLRRCAADTSGNWGGQITVYPPEARQLVELIDQGRQCPELESKETP